MNPDQRIIPIEATHPRSVLVTRHIFDGSNRFGKPHAQTLEDQLFGSFAEAFHYASEDQTVHHHFETNLNFPIEARLLNPQAHNELLEVAINGAKGVSPRMVEGHHAVSTDYGALFTLIIEGLNETAFDRGVSWVDTIPETAHFSFTVLGHNSGWQTNLQQDLEALLQRTNIVLRDLSQGMLLKRRPQLK